MNSNELLKSIKDRLYSSGIVDDVQKFLNEHPEYWSEKVNCDGFISTMHVTLSMQCDSGVQIMHTKPILFMDIGNYNSTEVTLNHWPDDHSSGDWHITSLNRQEVLKVTDKEIEKYVQERSSIQ